MGESRAAASQLCAALDGLSLHAAVRVDARDRERLERARDEGVQVYMTLQTPWGFVQMYVYETGGLGVLRFHTG